MSVSYTHLDVYKRQIVDEEAAPVVKQIFSLCLAGNGPTKIARVLTALLLACPGEPAV